LHTFSSGSGNGTVSYTVDANTNAIVLVGTINVGGQIFTVNQAGVVLTTLHSFGDVVGAAVPLINGGTPYGGVVQGNDGNF
jgi:hypothetical protein